MYKERMRIEHRLFLLLKKRLKNIRCKRDLSPTYDLFNINTKEGKKYDEVLTFFL